MRTACSSGRTKIFPSPIWPVLAAAPMASTTCSTRSPGTAISSRSLGRKFHRVFGAAVDLHVSFLSPVALHFGHGHAVNADAGEGVAHFVELERFDDGDHKFHALRSKKSQAAIDVPHNENPPRSSRARAPVARPLPKLSTRRVKIKHDRRCAHSQTLPARGFRSATLSDRPAAARRGRARGRARGARAPIPPGRPTRRAYRRA